MRNDFLHALRDLLATDSRADDELAQAAARATSAELGDTVMVFRLSDDGRWLVPVALVAPNPPVQAVMDEMLSVRLRADRGFRRAVISSGRSLLLPETSNAVLQATTPEGRAYLEASRVTSLVIAPMRTRGKVIGLVSITRSRQPPLDEDDERFAQAVADLLGLAIGVPHGAPLPVMVEGGLPELSDREREVLRMVALGHTSRQISEHLVISVRTVEWHRNRIYRKLGVSDRAELVHLARRSGYVE